MSRPVDYQRSLVYKWEHDEIRPHYPTGIAFEAVALILGRASLITGVEIEWEINSRARRWAWGGKHVTLPNPQRAKWAYSVPVALHEAAHVVCYHKRIDDRHGPMFVGTFLQLLRTCGGGVGKRHVQDWALAAAERGIQMTNMRSLVEHNVTGLAANYQGDSE